MSLHAFIRDKISENEEEVKIVSTIFFIKKTLSFYNRVTHSLVAAARAWNKLEAEIANALSLKFNRRQLPILAPEVPT